MTRKRKMDTPLKLKALDHILISLLDSIGSTRTANLDKESIMNQLEEARNITLALRANNKFVQEIREYPAKEEVW